MTNTGIPDSGGTPRRRLASDQPIPRLADDRLGRARLAVDLHRGLLRGYRVPRHPRELRYRLHGAKAARRVEIQQITFLPERFVR